MTTNLLKEKIRQGRPVIGTWNTLGSPLVTDVLSASGLDFVIVDMEHGPFDLSNVHAFVNACASYGTTPLFRIPVLTDSFLLQALDQGAPGVMVPHIDTLSQARELVDSVKYFPLGKRGYSPFTKYGGFVSADPHQYAEVANKYTLVSIVIESLEGLRNLDEILTLPEIDVVYFGAFDLSQALGVPGMSRHAKVVEAIRSGVEKVRKANKCAGGSVAQKPEDIPWMLDLGITFLTYDVDAALLRSQYAQVVEHFRGVAKV